MRSRILFLLLLTPTFALFGQQAVALTDYFQQLEAEFNCTFSYEDAALANHRYSTSDLPNDLPTALEALQANTLFDYKLLQDNTVTVAPKSGVGNYCIVVISRETGNPLEGAKVSTPYQQLSTDDRGKVNVSYVDSLLEFEVSYLSYADYRDRIDPNLVSGMCYTVALAQQAESLNPVLLSNFITKGISKKADGAFNVNYDAFDILPGLIESDVLLTLKELPGIQSVNETVSFLNIRGGTNDQNLILWDGIKMYQSGHFFGLISAFNPNLTKEVNVYKSVGNARYGDGVSGIISMEGSEDLIREFKVNTGLNLLSADAMAEIPINDQLSIEVAGRQSLNSLFTTPTYEAYFDKAFQNTELQSAAMSNRTSDADFNFFDAHLRLQYEPTVKDKFRLSLLRLGNRLDFLENGMLEGEPQARQSNLTQDNSSAGLYYRRSWNQRVQTSVQWYGSGYELTALNADIENDQRLIQENDLVETGIKVENQWRLNSRLVWQQGYQFNETGITNFENINNPTFERLEKQVLRTHSLYSSLFYETTNGKTRIEAGLRANHINKFNEVLVEPRVRVIQRVGRNLSIELLAALNSQTTSQVIDLQNDFLGIENRRWVLSDPGNIPIIKGRHLGMGFSYQRKGWLFSAEPYWKEIDGITSQSQGFQDQFEDRRTHGTYSVIGLDFLANKQWENTNIWVSYSLAQNDYDFDEFNPSEFRNNLDIRHVLSLGANFNLGRFNLGAGLNWHSGRPFTPVGDNSIPQVGFVDYLDPNSVSLDDYFRVDASATYTYDLSEKVRLVSGISLWNLLSNDNVVNTFYRINDEQEVQQIDDLALRFTPNATLRIIIK
ncbi:TonB-dependent receptor plug domain-containing protein [Gilvibacter sediminis]|uniref:TonB-dependent receptor plug domain-containing protein n=1 Tax=Gilvibacter sediminis TaxID=379071 RepID=UPI00234FBB95|nr:TonB-dependent receptor [Gilvibacter sediminis]MDC7997668.1 TonB-dependent receptor [Gilvibacter sediminis]